MRLTSTSALIAFGFFVAVIVGCESDKSTAGNGGSSDPVIGAPTMATPTMPGTVVLCSNGGSGAGQTGSNGGAAGQIIAQATTGGRILTDDNRSRPTIDNNIITATETADSVVTYAELVTIEGSNADVTLAVAAGVATFTIANGADVQIASGVTLNLSDAPAARWTGWP